MLVVLTMSYLHPEVLSAPVTDCHIFNSRTDLGLGQLRTDGGRITAPLGDLKNEAS